VRCTLPATARVDRQAHCRVRALCGTALGRIVSGSYDGAVRALAKDGAELSAAHAHAGGVTALAAMAAPGGAAHVLSGGKDCGACVWREDGDSVAAVLRLEGHTDAVEAVAARGQNCATAGWDNAIRVWPWARLAADLEAGDSAGAAKRQRTERGAAAGAAACPSTAACSAVLEGHTAAVSGLAWAADASLFSCSWDHSLRRWDALRGQLAGTVATGKALLCVVAAGGDAGSGAAPGVVASGGADGVLRVWDSRASRQEALVRAPLVTSCSKWHQRWLCMLCCGSACACSRACKPFTSSIPFGRAGSQGVPIAVCRVGGACVAARVGAHRRRRVARRRAAHVGPARAAAARDAARAGRETARGRVARRQHARRWRLRARGARLPGARTWRSCA
jgi:WD domain, G-beta repeat